MAWPTTKTKVCDRCFDGEVQGAMKANNRDSSPVQDSMKWFLKGNILPFEEWVTIRCCRGTGDIEGLEFNPCDSNVYVFARTSPYWGRDLEYSIYVWWNLHRQERPSEFDAIFLNQESITGTALVVQWLRLCTSTAGGMGLRPGWGTKTSILWDSAKRKW